MRDVFFTLLFVNLGYFAWSHWVDSPRPPQVNESITRLPRLKLATERPAPQPGANTAGKTALNEPPGCMSVGPFGDVDNSARAAALLRAKGFDPRQRAEAGETLLEYWVYVGGMKSDADTDRVLRSLQRAGFRDALVMRDSGDVARRVSLGLFNERARADQRAWAARLKGFQVEVTERKLPGTVYWVDLAPLPGMGTVPIQDLFAVGLSSRITVQPCPAVSRPKGAAAAELVTAVRESASASFAQTQIAGTPKLP